MDLSFCEKGILMLFQKMEPREDMGCTQNVCCISAVDYTDVSQINVTKAPISMADFFHLKTG